METSNIQTRVNNVIDGLSRDYYCMTPILKNIEFRPTTTCPTMGVAQNGWGVYNPNFVDNLSDSELKFTLLHEASHILLRHPERSATYAGVERDKLNRIKNPSPEVCKKFELMNIAEDAIINDNLKKTTPFTMVEGGVTMAKVSANFGGTPLEELRKMSAEEMSDMMYKYLEQHPQQSKNGNGQQSDQGQQGQGNGQSSSSDSSSNDGQQSSGSAGSGSGNQQNGGQGSSGGQSGTSQNGQQQGDDQNGGGQNGDNNKDGQQQKNNQSSGGSDQGDQQQNKGQSNGDGDSYMDTMKKIAKAIEEVYGKKPKNKQEMEDAIEEALRRATSQDTNGNLPHNPIHGQGSGHSDEHRVLEQSFVKNSIDWKKTLYALTQKMSGKNERGRTWRRPNRKYRNIYPISQGHARNKKKDLVFSIDVSGSMDHEKITRAMSTVDSYAQHNDLNFKYYFFKDDYSQIFTYRNKEDFRRNLEMAGSGGTSYHAAVRFDDYNFHPNGLVVISDMEFGDIANDLHLIEDLVKENFVFLDVGGDDDEGYWHWKDDVLSAYNGTKHYSKVR